MPYLIISTGGEEIDRRPLMRPGTVIGRSHEADVKVPDSLMSRRHCQFDLIGTHWFVTDLQSRNGTTLNGRSILRAQLFDGDTLRTGRTSIRFHTGILEPRPHPATVPTVRPEDPSSPEAIGLSDTLSGSMVGLNPLRLPTPQPKPSPHAQSSPGQSSGSSIRSAMSPPDPNQP